jgi:hypothetical protein
MISPKKIHLWITRALEEPFFRAEMHRVEMILPGGKEANLQLIEGGRKSKASGHSGQMERVGRFAARY